MEATMTSRHLVRILALVAAAAVGCGFGSKEKPAAAQAKKGGGLDVELCDGETKTSVPKDMPATRENGALVAADLMAQWQRKHPDRDWIAEEREKHTIVPPADNKSLVGKQEQGQTYGSITERDVLVWQHETLAFVTHGSTVFHSGDELGSTIGVSCDMCHPDAANTHPETYPKFQPQLGRVALLRDMVNWCIEHPVRGTKLAPDDPKMRALEAYITAQRKGKTLNYGAR
jgi:cytochrome c553